MSEGSRVLVALRVPASPDRAFQAFTDEIGSWWQPNGLFRFSAGHGGTLAFDPGPQGRLTETYADGSVFTIGEILVWEPPFRLALSWRQTNFAPDQTTELHVRFEPVGHETRVVVEHNGWDRIPRTSAARHGFDLPVFQQRFAEWWQQLLAEFSRTASGTSHRSEPPT